MRFLKNSQIFIGLYNRKICESKIWMKYGANLLE